MSKKIMGIAVVILIILSNFKLVHAESDVTPPVITDMTWSATELKTGDTLNITIDANDVESGISTGYYDNSIFIVNGSGQYKCAYLSYDETTNQLKGSFNITSDMPSGKWVLDFISVKDKAGNSKNYHQCDFNEQYSVNITTETTDITPPIITDMTWSATDLKTGDTLNITIDANDAESGISTGYYDNSIFIENGSGQYKCAYLSYDETTNQLKGSFYITSDMPSGKWVLDFISVKDKAGNSKNYHQCDFNEQYSVNITTETADITPPIITDMTWSVTELTAGDTLDITIDANDSESGIGTGYYDNCIFIENTSGQYKCAYLSYDETANQLKGSFNITPDIPSGKWVLDFISVKDKAGNSKNYHQSDFNKEYSVNIKSVFNGTDNITIPKGSVFNALDGVTAESSYEGDFTSKITYQGNVDTSNEGIYLIKYEATGKNGDIYRDYRWITVVNSISSNSNGIFFNNDIKFNTSDLIDINNMSITKDGASYNLSGSDTINEEGKYCISFNTSGTSTIKQIQSSNVSLMGDAQSSGITPSSIEFTIDKTNPAITGVYPQTIIEGNQINADKFISASDNNASVEYCFRTQPDWLKIGTQDVQIGAMDLAGNVTYQNVTLTILDKCDLDSNGHVDICDLAGEAQNYNVNNKSTKWNDRYDFNKDSIIDLYDMIILSKRMVQ